MYQFFYPINEKETKFYLVAFSMKLNPKTYDDISFSRDLLTAEEIGQLSGGN